MYGLWAKDASDLRLAPWNHLAIGVSSQGSCESHSLNIFFFFMQLSWLNPFFYFHSFVCDGCLKKTNKTRKENKYSAKSKWQCFLWFYPILSPCFTFIQERVFNPHFYPFIWDCCRTLIPCCHHLPTQCHKYTNKHIWIKQNSKFLIACFSPC